MAAEIADPGAGPADEIPRLAQGGADVERRVLGAVRDEGQHEEENQEQQQKTEQFAEFLLLGTIHDSPAINGSDFIRNRGEIQRKP